MIAPKRVAQLCAIGQALYWSAGAVLLSYGDVLVAGVAFTLAAFLTVGGQAAAYEAGRGQE